MKTKLLLHIFIVTILLSEETKSIKETFYDLSAIGIDGDTVRMDKFQGKMILLVNVASRCGFTSQYKDLQELHEKHDNSVVILGFPSNDFLWQEPGSNSEIKAFCRREYGVTFQMFEKIHVKGKKQHPLYQWLSEDNKNGWNNKPPSWNFCKYLINENGKLLQYFGPEINPQDSVITNYLNPTPHAKPG